jgi:hypothetical protein
LKSTSHSVGQFFVLLKNHRFLLQVQASNSVICTELFHQGRIDLPTYMADAQFGARLRLGEEGKAVLAGYHALAAPVVWTMQRSEAVSGAVHALARPWIDQMAHEEGHASDGHPLGKLMMVYGMPACALVGGIVRVMPAGAIAMVGSTLLASLLVFLTLKRR